MPPANTDNAAFEKREALGKAQAMEAKALLFATLVELARTANSLLLVVTDKVKNSP